MVPRMKNTILVAFLVLASAGTARAGGVAGSIGVGAEFQIAPVGGVSVNYDTGRFHFGGFVGVADPAGASNTRFDLGGRFFYHLASTASSDFSIGGSLGISSRGNGPNVDRTLLLFIEPSFQIRAFIVSNVALSFTGGFSIGAADASDLVIDGGLTGAAGVHYYF
jgi:hypothetical protein